MKTGGAGEKGLVGRGGAEERRRTDDGAALGELCDGGLVGFRVPDITLWKGIEANPPTVSRFGFLDPAVLNSRSIQPIHILDILLQVLSNLRELAAARADHVQLSDLSSSTKVKHGETDDTDLLVRLGATGTGPTGGVLRARGRLDDGACGRGRGAYLAGTAHQDFKGFGRHGGRLWNSRLF